MIIEKTKSDFVNPGSAVFLGCSWKYLSVLFDLCHESNGATVFHVFQNVEVDAPQDDFSSIGYNCIVYKPGMKKNHEGLNLYMGLPGPFAKYAVFRDFSKELSLEQNAINTLIHPSAYVASSSMLGAGNVIEPHVIISSRAETGFCVTIKRGSSVGHHAFIGDYVEVNPGVIIASGVYVGQSCIIGSGTVIREGLTIGKNSKIGMGSVVTRDIPEGVVAFGNPCRVLRDNEIRKP